MTVLLTLLLLTACAPGGGAAEPSIAPSASASPNATPQSVLVTLPGAAASPTAAPSPSATPFSLTGDWALTLDGGLTLTLTLSADGSYRLFNGESTAAGSYEDKGDSLVFTSPAGAYTVDYDYGEDVLTLYQADFAPLNFIREAP